MNVCIIGSGYVGISAGVGFAIKGNNVIFVEINKSIVDRIRRGESHIYEPGIDKWLRKFVKMGHIEATTNIKKAIETSDIFFICVGTPSKRSGEIDLRYIKSVSKSIGNVLKSTNKNVVVVVKSTVLPGTTENVVAKIIENVSGKRVGIDFYVAMNPEFLREGSALQDFLNPDRIVIGANEKYSRSLLKKLYANFKVKKIFTSIMAAEMIKYASNAFLACKISFINEIGNLCKKLGIDVYEIANGMGMDKRIERRFLDAGVGFGGSCFPKDVSAIIFLMKKLGFNARILKAVMDVNKEQRKVIVKLLENRSGKLKGKTITVLGLAFKANSDDIRESPAIDVIAELLKKGARVKAYDPKAMDRMKKIHKNIYYAKNVRDALKDSDACIVLTDWDEFKMLGKNDFEVMRKKIIIEGRRVFYGKKGINVEGICW